jgi:hypothetical protein
VRVGRSRPRRGWGSSPTSGCVRSRRDGGEQAVAAASAAAGRVAFSVAAALASAGGACLACLAARAGPYMLRLLEAVRNGATLGCNVCWRFLVPTEGRGGASISVPLSPLRAVYRTCSPE